MNLNYFQIDKCNFINLNQVEQIFFNDKDYQIEFCFDIHADVNAKIPAFVHKHYPFEEEYAYACLELLKKINLYHKEIIVGENVYE